MADYSESDLPSHQEFGEPELYFVRRRLELKGAQPDWHLSGFSELPIDDFVSRGIEHVCVDVDGCLCMPMQHELIDPSGVAALDEMRYRFKSLSIASNNELIDLSPFAKRFGFSGLFQPFGGRYIAYKPSSNYYNRILEELGNVDPATVLMIGDSPLDDIFGAKRVGMYAALIDRLDPNGLFTDDFDTEAQSIQTAFLKRNPEQDQENISPLTADEVLGSLYSATEMTREKPYLTREHFIESAFSGDALPTKRQVAEAATEFARFVNACVRVRKLMRENSRVRHQLSQYDYFGNLFVLRDQAGLPPFNDSLTVISGIARARYVPGKTPGPDDQAIHAGVLMRLVSDYENKGFSMRGVSPKTMDIVKRTLLLVPPEVLVDIAE